MSNNNKSASIQLPAIESPSASLVAELNQADTTWILFSACLVFLMIPGIGIYHGGIIQRKNHLTLLMTSVLAISIISIQWFLYGFSISFAPNGTHGLIGNLDNFAMMNIGTKPYPAAPTIPSNLFALFQGFYAAIAPCIAFGSAAERTPLSVYLIFLLFWSTFVYDLIAFWNWSPNGWLAQLGSLDFAGGTTVHITAGFSALAYAIVVGSRQLVNFRKTKPTNNFEIFLGTVLIWFGWFGFNGGREFSINSRAVNAIINTNLSACVGGLSWTITNMIRSRSRLISLNGFCSGVISGLVAVTPASGYISPVYSLVFGLLAGVLCNLACEIKRVPWFNIDDACNVFAIHGVGGMIGQLLTGIFADNSIVTMSGDEALKNGAGWLNGNFKQLLFQLIAVLATSVWSFTVTFIIMLLIRMIPFINIRYSMVKEEIGSDLVEIGASSYGHDLLNFDDTSIKQLRTAQTGMSPDDHFDANGSQYIVKTKYGSMPNRGAANRVHQLHPSSLICCEDDERTSSAITSGGCGGGGISEFFCRSINCCRCSLASSQSS